jgi:hypothetical protein
MRRLLLQMSTGAILAIGVVGCGSASSGSSGSSGSSRSSVGAAAPVRQAHAQAVQPAAGVQAEASPAGGGAEVVGDPNAHAPPLSEVKRELNLLNLCGGTNNTAFAAPLVKSKGPGFVPDPGTSQTEGQLPLLTARLDALAKALGVVIYGISGYRTPAHSVAVGGYADDPHTKGLAEDIGVNSLLRSSAAQISEAELAKFGLYRPFDPSGDPNNTEVNHIQLIPAGGPQPLSATNFVNPDPRCRSAGF